MNPTNNPILWAVALAVLAAAAWVVKDYREWKALGKGGVPYNFYGWMLVTWLRLETRETLSTGQYADRIGGPEDSVRLPAQPQREGARPRMGKHPVPHRQLDQKPEDGEARKLLDQVFDRFVDGNGTYVRYTKSFYEKRNDAVTLLEGARARRLARLSQGEVAHIHPGDGSMHMIFSPSDAKQVIDKGWGERHPLAGVAKRGMPDTYLMIYTPRNAAEVAVVKALLRAAVEHMGACDCVAG